MKEFHTYAPYLYNFVHIPVFFFTGTTCTDCFPESASRYTPSLEIYTALQIEEMQISYIRSDDDVFWGMIRLENCEQALIIGPVAYALLTDHAIAHLAKEFAILPHEKQIFYEFISSIPCLLPDNFINLLYFTDALLNPVPAPARIPPKTIMNFKDIPLQNRELYHTAFYDASENQILYNNEALEKEYTEIIQSGNLTRLKNFSAYAHQNAHLGATASDSLRQVKNMFIICATLTSRAAIRGGVSPTTAHLACDTYMIQAEKLFDKDSIYQLMQTLQVDYCTQVAHAKEFSDLNQTGRKAIEYVHQHISEKIQVEDVAEALGFSRSYLARQFKKEMGFALSAFILRCKLEEAKSQLLYSDKSISHISEYLCFSSQSHFQTVFKKQFGMTPLECRKRPLHE